MTLLLEKEKREVLSSAVISRLRSAGCVYAEEEAMLLLSAARTLAELDEMADRRVSGVPLEHILGWAEFSGLRIAVGPGVFIPRRRTEFLVHEALFLARQASQPIVVDLCCGSGAVGAALAAAMDTVELYASDIDAEAVNYARRNLAGIGQVFQGDLFEPLPGSLYGRVNVLVANAPYVPTHAIGSMPSEARLHEARTALDGGGDGLAIQRRITASAPIWLAPGGHVLVETSERQAPQTAKIFARHGLLSQIARSAELEAAVVIGTKPIFRKVRA